MEIAGKVIGGPRRDIPHVRPAGEMNEPRHRLMQGPVPAAAHHPVKAAPQIGGSGGCVRLSLGGISCHQPALLGKGIHHVGYMSPDAALSGVGVIDEQQTFHAMFLLSVPLGC